MKINSCHLGLAGGILWGVCMFIFTLLAAHTGYAYEFMALMESVYPGYSISNIGSIVGLIYGFLDGFVGLFLLAWLYNTLGCCCRCNDSSCDTKSNYNTKQ